MQFYFIRHGQSANNLLWDRTGASKGRSHDPELTETGVQQARRLARFLSRVDPDAAANGDAPYNQHNAGGFRLTHLYSSLMVRAVATGIMIAEAIGLPLMAWEDWHEAGGIYLEDEATGEPVGQPGPNRAYFTQHYPGLQLPETLGEAGWWNRPFEMPDQRSVRAQRVLRDLIDRHGGADDRVAVISHGGFYNHFMAALLHLPDRDGVWFMIHNAAVTRIDFHSDGVALVYLNRVDFLPPELIT